MEDQARYVIKDHKIMVWLLFFSVFISQIGEQVINPILPPLALARGISQSMIGIIVGIHPFFNIFVGLFLGRKKILIMGCVFQIIGGILQAELYYLPKDDKNLYIILATSARVIQGVGCAMVRSPSYSIVQSIFVDKQQVKVTGYLQLGFSIGNMFGLIEGSLLFSIGGYTLPFYVNSVILLILIPLAMKYLPSNREINMQKLIKPSDDDQSVDNQKASYLRILMDHKVFLTLLAIFIPLSQFTLMGPTYGIFLQESLGIEEGFSGYIMGVSSLTYAISCPMVSWLSSRINRRLIVFLGLIIMAISNGLVGAPEYGGLDNTVELQIMCRVVRGIGGPGTIIPTIFELQEFIKIRYPTHAQSYLNDIASGLWSSAFFLGELLGPVLGSLLVEIYGFPATLSFCCFSMLGLAFIYTIFFGKHYFSPNILHKLEYVTQIDDQFNKNKQESDENGNGNKSGADGNGDKLPLDNKYYGLSKKQIELTQLGQYKISNNQ